MKDKIFAVLNEIGLTGNEAKVYMALLSLKKANAIDISKKSKVHRVNTYDVLHRLLGKGLIAESQINGRKAYQVGNPEQLKKIIQAKEAALDNILPEIEKMSEIENEQEGVYEFHGPSGVLTTYYMMLNEKQTVYSIGSSGKNREYLEHRHDLFNLARKKAKLKAKVLYYELARGDSEKGWKDKDIEVRYLPNEFETISSVDICGDLVVNLIPGDDPKAIVIRNKTMADSYRNFFRFMWKHAKK